MIFVMPLFFRSGWLRGFEVPVLVVFGTYLLGPLNANVISRCVSNLILVLKDTDALKLKENRFFTTTKISGKYKFMFFMECTKFLVK